MNTTLDTIRNLSEAARELFSEILCDEPGLANSDDYEGRDGWAELIEKNLVRCWEDQFGGKWCEIGSQD